MAAVVSSVGRAGGGALACIVDTREILDAHVGVLAIGRGSVDGTTEADWTGIAIAW